MNQQDEKELGVTIAVLERFEKYTLPEALWLKERVDKGELLTDNDVEFLETVLENAVEIRSLVDDQPEYHSLYAKAVDLYEDITAKALENQQASNTKNGNT